MRTRTGGPVRAPGGRDPQADVGRCACEEPERTRPGVPRHADLGMPRHRYQETAMKRAQRRRLSLSAAAIAALGVLGGMPASAADVADVCALGCEFSTIQAAVNAAT